MVRGELQTPVGRSLQSPKTVLDCWISSAPHWHYGSQMKKVRPRCCTVHHSHRLLIGVPGITGTNFCTKMNGRLTLSRSNGSFKVIDILERWTDKQKGLCRSTNVHSFGILKLITRWWENWFFFSFWFSKYCFFSVNPSEHLTLIWKKLMNSKGMCPRASAAPCMFVLSGKCAWFS